MLNIGRPAAPLTAKQFGTLCLVGPAEQTKGRRLYIVRCTVCGAEKAKTSKFLRFVAASGASGCKCSSRSTKHGLHSHPLYGTWDGMLRRCYVESHVHYASYGGRGIAVCDEWRETPARFIAWAESVGWRHGLQIDRKDNDGSYRPDNCRFVEQTVNASNKRNNRRLMVNGESYTVAQAARKFGIGKTTIKQRLNRGLSGEAAVHPVLKAQAKRDAAEVAHA